MWVSAQNMSMAHGRNKGNRCARELTWDIFFWFWPRKSKWLMGAATEKDGPLKAREIGFSHFWPGKSKGIGAARKRDEPLKAFYIDRTFLHCWPRKLKGIAATREKYWPLKACEIGLLGSWPRKSTRHMGATRGKTMPLSACEIGHWGFDRQNQNCGFKTISNSYLISLCWCHKTWGLDHLSRCLLRPAFGSQSGSSTHELGGSDKTNVPKLLIHVATSTNATWMLQTVDTWDGTGPWESCISFG